MKKTKRFLVAICLLIVSATLLGTASYAWFSMNTEVNVDGIRVEAYSDSLFLEISKTGADDAFATNVDFTTEGEQVLRLAKHGFVGDKVYTIVAVKASGNYTGSVPTADGVKPSYYKLVAATSDSFEKYVKAEAGTDLKLGTSLADLYENLQFERQTTGKAVAGTTYYELAAGKYTSVKLTTTDDVKGYYVLKTADPAALTTGNYAGANNYFAKTVVGSGDEAVTSYADVTSTLELGTDLSAFYTIAPTEVAATAAKGDIYLAGTGEAADEYAYLATYANETNIKDALYFGRAYSDVIADGDQTDMLNILKTEDPAYLYKQTVFLRNALNTNDSKNLTATVTVGGAENEIAKALRVLLVVTDPDSGARVNYAYYENTGRTLVYGDGDSNIVDVLLGNKDEVLKVEIYVYFDGTDPVAENADIAAGLLNGQTVSIAFNVDGHDYNAPYTPPASEGGEDAGE